MLFFTLLCLLSFSFFCAYNLLYLQVSTSKLKTEVQAILVMLLLSVPSISRVAVHVACSLHIISMAITLETWTSTL